MTSGFGESNKFSEELPDEWVDKEYTGPHVVNLNYDPDRAEMEYGDAASFYLEIDEEKILLRTVEFKDVLEGAGESDIVELMRDVLSAAEESDIEIDKEMKWEFNYPSTF